MKSYRNDDIYAKRYESVLVPLAERLEQHIKDAMNGVPHIDRITARAKSPSRFIAKANKLESGKRKYDEPFHQIQDQIGARIIAFYLDDVEQIALQVQKYFRAIEEREVVPDSDSEFGYFGKHFILFLPTDVIRDEDGGNHPKFFELQVKTLFQHAWSEANHDLAYKPLSELTTDQKRKIAFTSAQAWGADQIFEDLRRQLLVT